QLIQIKTLPIAEGDQWRIFPSANAAMGDISIALVDSLLDPVVNPAKGARVTRGGAFFGSPTFYSLSKRAGGGRTLPLGGMLKSGNVFAAFSLAIQELDTIRGAPQFFNPTLQSADGTLITPASPSRENKYAFGSVGRAFPANGVSLAASMLWSGLNDVDGTDLLYAGSAGVAQHGGSVDARVGVTKDWALAAGRQTLEAIVLHDHFSMTHDVTWPQEVWDPNARTFAMQGRVEHNLDQTDTWGMQLAFSRPLSDSLWRIGAIATGNLASHPKLPDYQLAQQIVVVPWDPGHSTAGDLGLGVSKVQGATTFGLDAIYEPIATHTWGEAQSPLGTPSGATINPGGMTTENRFHFSNAILRTGVGRDLDLGNHQTLRLEAGVGLRTIDYRLHEIDHVAETDRWQHESWNEWTRTWGLSLHFDNLELRYAGRSTTGTGRPGITQQDFIVPGVATASTGPNILSAPNGNLSLTGVTTTTHQFSVSLPVR
ncbi:MAG: hypothetical protein ACHQWU_08895, partial [Gemmatimonadales bacterium]